MATKVRDGEPVISVAAVTREDWLLASPRGRRMCWAALTDLARPSLVREFREAEMRGEADHRVRLLPGVVASVDLESLSCGDDELALLDHVATSVDRARYYRTLTRSTLSLATTAGSGSKLSIPLGRNTRRFSSTRARTTPRRRRPTARWRARAVRRRRSRGFDR